MEKNGKLFISAIKTREFISSVWDPYIYRRNGERHALSQYAIVQKINSKLVSHKLMPFSPIEYKDIPHGSYLSFALEPKIDNKAIDLPVVGEEVLLLGTMRAYLGNIIVTPHATWINHNSPIYFQVKSEFAIVSPQDELTYFWLAYMRSKEFLENLPLGSGGTRPRLHTKTLEQTPVTVPPLKVRREIHDRLKELAKAEWNNYSNVESAIDTLTS